MRVPAKSFTDLEVWQKAHSQLATYIRKLRNP